MRILIFTLSFLTTLSANAICRDLVCRLSQENIACKKTDGGDICVLPPSSLYSEPIAILIPAGIRVPQEAVLFLHGYLGICDKGESSRNPTKLNNEMGLLSQLSEHGDNAIIVMPMSAYCKGESLPSKCGQTRCDTHTNELVPRFPKILANIQKILNLQRVDWQVDAHSAGGAIAAQILSQNPAFASKVIDVGLMDATYCSDVTKGNWQKAIANGSFKVHSRYGGSVADSKKLSKLKRFISKPAWSNEHCAIPKHEFANLLETANKEVVDTATSGPDQPSEANH